MRLDATARDALHEAPPRQDQSLPLRDVPALVARLRRLAHSQPTAVLGAIDYWLGPPLEIDPIAADRLDFEA